MLKKSELTCDCFIFIISVVSVSVRPGYNRRFILQPYIRPVSSHVSAACPLCHLCPRRSFACMHSTRRERLFMRLNTHARVNRCVTARP